MEMTALLRLWPLVLILGLLQLVLPVLLALVLRGRVGRRAPRALPRSVVTLVWLVQAALVGLAALVAGWLWSQDGCITGVTGSPFCDRFAEGPARRLATLRDLGGALVIGAPVGAAMALLAEWRARRPPPGD
jgi:hypothetical protein